MVFSCKVLAHLWRAEATAMINGQYIDTDAGMIGSLIMVASTESGIAANARTSEMSFVLFMGLWIP